MFSLSMNTASQMVARSTFFPDSIDGHGHHFTHPVQAIGHQCQCERTPKRRRIVRTRHKTGMAGFAMLVRLCVKYGDVCSLRNDFVIVLWQQANQLQSPRCLQIGQLEGTLSDELFLLGDNPGHVEVIRRLSSVGVLPNDNVTLFRPQHVHGLCAIGSQVIGTSERPQSFPNMAGMAPGNVDLECQLS